MQIMSVKNALTLAQQQATSVHLAIPVAVNALRLIQLIPVVFV